MKYMILFWLCLSTFALSHPVSYTINLEVSYDENEKKALVKCKSNSRNKCGLYNIKLLDKDENEIKTKRFPFLKKEISINSEKKPAKLLFFLRKVPEHSYTKIFED